VVTTSPYTEDENFSNADAVFDCIGASSYSRCLAAVPARLVTPAGHTSILQQT
jgi:hypothetical protein